MATPIGHLLAGAAIGTALSRGNDVPRAAAIGALAGIAADFDFLPGFMLGQLSRFHHQQSHSLMFALFATFLAMVFAKEGKLRWALLVGLAYTSHLALDLITFDDSPPHGIPIFWPWATEVFHSPVTLFPNVPWGSGFVLSAHNVNLLIRELGFLGPLFLGAYFYARRRRRVLQEDVK
jgi:inner membrane protein